MSENSSESRASLARFTSLASSFISGVKTNEDTNAANSLLANKPPGAPPTAPLPVPHQTQGNPPIQLKLDTISAKNASGETGDMEFTQPQDSLSLKQLKQYVAEGVKPRQQEYAYVYRDSDPLPDELSEWFSYAILERDLLLEMKDTFEERWAKFCQRIDPGSKVYGWRNSPEKRRRSFVIRCVEGLESASQWERIEALEALAYIVCGVYGETTGPEDQLLWIKENTLLVAGDGVFEAAFQVFRGAMSQGWDSYLEDLDPKQKIANYKELRNSLTVMYFLLEVLRRKEVRDEKAVNEFREELLSLEPNLLVFLVKTVARTRWDDVPDLPLVNVLLLIWKTILLVFGSPENDLPSVKAWARKKAGLAETVAKDLITASPLEYHTFRQEIIAKYPAYNPPEPLLPFENDTTNILPSTSAISMANRTNGTDTNSSGFGGGAQSSIMHQPVHIATPMPSPPPSPAPPGVKGAKKQNYQTNQSFPFIYPPENFESTVSKKFAKNEWWKIDPDEEGGVPLSIKEAGELFKSRIRMTLAMKQLWQQREEFLRHERGWAPQDKDGASSSQDPENMEESRLQAVEEFYAKALPHLQSFVIVLLKSIIATFPPVPPPQNQPQRPPHQAFNTAAGDPPPGVLPGDAYFESVDKERKAEILAKAITAILLLQLKWLRVSHVLKFEYLTQLLMDASYIQLLLKIFQTQDPVMTGQRTLEWKQHSFFSFCNQHSAAPQSPQAIGIHDHSPDDDVFPPDISRQRPNTLQHQQTFTPQNPGYPQQQHTGEPGTDTEPSTPPYIITEFSSRLFFTYINYLRILQKIVKGKTHRNLLLIQFKASQALRKPLAKLPQEDSRMYTLKLFKGQVPYCGRKWRQSHMRFITAIYLHCRPALRDDWLVGTDLEAELEDALPRETSLRSLTQFYNHTQYPKALQPVHVPDEGELLLEEERDFFARELEKMEISGTGSEVEHMEEEIGWGPDVPVMDAGWN